MTRKEKILQLRSQGLSYREIGEKVGLHKRTIEWYCHPERYNKMTRNRRRNLKAKLVDSMGGKCIKCGYNKSMSALDFHHRDASQKIFGISKGISQYYDFEKLLKEAKKCDILCSNCHHEKHDEENTKFDGS